MTREEAIEILDTIPTIGEQVDALEIAIRSLEAWDRCLYQLEKQKSIDGQPRAIGRAIRIVSEYLKEVEK